MAGRLTDPGVIFGIEDAVLYAALYATRIAALRGTYNATFVPNHPTPDHLTALLERAKELAR